MGTYRMRGPRRGNVFVGTSRDQELPQPNRLFSRHRGGGSLRLLQKGFDEKGMACLLEEGGAGGLVGLGGGQDSQALVVAQLSKTRIAERAGAELASGQG